MFVKRRFVSSSSLNRICAGCGEGRPGTGRGGDNKWYQVRVVMKTVE